MSHAELAKTIDEAFAQRDGIGPSTKGAVREAVEAALELLDRGTARVAERGANGTWSVNQWLKKAVLLSFRLNDMTVIPGGPGKAVWWDKVASKFEGWGENRFREAGFRAVPGCVVRRSAYVAPGVVLMPSFVNLGAYVDAGTMIDTWATVGSCAQIGKNCHISGGAEIDTHREHRALAHCRSRDRRDLPGRGAALFGAGAGLDAGQARQGWRREPQSLLRGDRQARRREDA